MLNFRQIQCGSFSPSDSKMGNICSKPTQRTNHNTWNDNHSTVQPRPQHFMIIQPTVQKPRQQIMDQTERQPLLENSMSQIERLRLLDKNLKIQKQQHLAKMEQLFQTEPSVFSSPNNDITYFWRLNYAICIQLLSENNLIPTCNVNLSRDQKVKKAVTNLVGRFECKHSKNVSKWTSGKIFTEIFVQLVQDGKFNFAVKVYNQKCKKCQAICSPQLDEAVYNERVVSKIMLLLGLRERIENTTEHKKTPPHRKDLCCGCLEGKCLEGGSY